MIRSRRKRRLISKERASGKYQLMKKNKNVQDFPTEKLY
jgi:hypothetical protein